MTHLYVDRISHEIATQIETGVSGLTNQESARLLETATETNVLDSQAAIIAQVNANESKIDLLETKTQADNRQATLIAEHDATQAGIAGLNNLSAGQIRSELSTELSRIDTTISSRLPASGYTAPMNEAIFDQIVLPSFDFGGKTYGPYTFRDLLDIAASGASGMLSGASPDPINTIILNSLNRSRTLVVATTDEFGNRTDTKPLEQP